MESIELTNDYLLVPQDNGQLVMTDKERQGFVLCLDKGQRDVHPVCPDAEWYYCYHDPKRFVPLDQGVDLCVRLRSCMTGRSHVRTLTDVSLLRKIWGAETALVTSPEPLRGFIAKQEEGKWLLARRFRPINLYNVMPTEIAAGGVQKNTDRENDFIKAHVNEAIRHIRSMMIINSGLIMGIEAMIGDGSAYVGEKFIADRYLQDWLAGCSYVTDKHVVIFTRFLGAILFLKSKIDLPKMLLLYPNRALDLYKSYLRDIEVDSAEASRDMRFLISDIVNYQNRSWLGKR